MPFSEDTMTRIKQEEYKVSHLYGAYEYADIGWQFSGMHVQMPFEALFFALGAVAGGIASGFLSSIGNDLYQKLKTFFQKERTGIVELGQNHKKLRGNVFCYAFVFRHESKIIAVAFDVGAKKLPQYVEDAEPLVIREIDGALQEISEDKDVLEIALQRDLTSPKGEIIVSHRWRCASESNIWLNNAVGLDPDEL